MTRFLVYRILHSLVVIVGVTIIAFLLLHHLPGGPARSILGAKATPVAIAAFNKEYGLDASLPVQYLRYVDLLLHGNLGYSYKLNISVDSLLGLDLPKTFFLVGISFLIAALIAVPLGIVQAIRRNRLVDHSLTGASFLLYSMPTFWLALLLIDLLSARLQLFPPEAPQGTTLSQVITDPLALVLPVLTLVLVNFALFSRYIRASAIESLAQDYIKVARSKGLPERKILWSHVLRNSMLPIVTLLGLSLPWLFTAGLVIEQIFNYPGTGLLFFTSAQAQDYPVELGITIVIAVTTVVGNLLADLAYAVLDPRIRYS
ncbi:MAG TPA: ABC transporter permease [Streptosporangiaceae bacterium]|nr:ABC transporter permease [Streptosporangiaceae bacterium]